MHEHAGAQVAAVSINCDLRQREKHHCNPAISNTSAFCFLFAQGYSLIYPERWLSVTITGNDCFLRNPTNINENVRFPAFHQIPHSLGLGCWGVLHRMGVAGQRRKPCSCAHLCVSRLVWP